MDHRPFVTDNEFEEIKQRCEHATSGPWKSYIEGSEIMSGSDFILTQGEDIYLTGAIVSNRDFMTQARQKHSKAHRRV